MGRCRKQGRSDKKESVKAKDDMLYLAPDVEPWLRSVREWA